MSNKIVVRRKSFWALQIPGWLLLCYLIYAQGISAFSYDLGVSMGTQESATVISPVGAAFWYGFAFADLLIYIPILLAGLIGHFKASRWGEMVMSAALGITIYWPVVCLAAIVDARGAAGWQLPSELPYWIVLPLITVWGIWGMYIVLNNPQSSQIVLR